MQSNNLQHQLVQKITIAVFAGLALWLGLLMQASSAVRESTVDTTQTVAVGPLALNQLTRQALEGGGYSVNLAFEPGLLWYFVAWIAIGALAGFVLGRAKQP